MGEQQSADHRSFVLREHRLKSAGGTLKKNMYSLNLNQQSWYFTAFKKDHANIYPIMQIHKHEWLKPRFF